MFHCNRRLLRPFFTFKVMVSWALFWLVVTRFIKELALLLGALIAVVVVIVLIGVVVAVVVVATTRTQTTKLRGCIT